MPGSLVMSPPPIWHRAGNSPKPPGIMSQYQSDLLRLLADRGYIHQVTDAAALDALATKQVVPGYIGFDPTAPSLHVGSLVQIMLLRRLQQAVIILRANVPIKGA